MRKFAVMVLAVMLVGVSSCAWAALEIRFNQPGSVYVGDEFEGKADSVAWVTANMDLSYLLLGATYGFSVTAGSLPPGCRLEHYREEDSIAYIVGTPKVAGIYSFNVYVRARGYDYDSNFRRVDRTDWGSVSCSIEILPARNTSGDNPTPAPISNDIGGNTSQDIPAPAPISQDTPAPIPSRDVPVPTHKPEVINVIAPKLGTTSDNVSYIAPSDMAAPQAPTSRITNALAALSLDIISTQGSLNISQSGYYAFPMTVPANLVGTNTELRVYLADRSVFGASSFSPSAITSSLTTAQIFTESGGEVTTLPGTIIAAANLGADTARTFSTHIVKAKTTPEPEPEPEPEPVTSSSGGCNSFTAILALTALILIRKSRR